MAKLDEHAMSAARLQSAAAKQSFGSWIEDMDRWDIFATVTLRDPESRYARGTYTQPGWGATLKATKALLRVTNAVAWVVVFEMQAERKVPHVHALLKTYDNLLAEPARIVDAQEVLFLYAGITRLKVYESDLGANYYLGKYLAKEQSYLTIGHRDIGAAPELW